MPTYLLTLQPNDFRDGILVPRLRLSRFRGQPHLGEMTRNSWLEMRRPDGVRCWTNLLALAVDDLSREAYSDADDATLYSFPNDPLIRLKLSSVITDEFAPPGTEIWLLDQQPSETEESA